MATVYENLFAACTFKDMKESERLFLQQNFSEKDEKDKTLMNMACIAAESSQPQLLDFCFNQGMKIASESLNSPLLHAAIDAGFYPGLSSIDR